MSKQPQKAPNQEPPKKKDRFKNIKQRAIRAAEVGVLGAGLALPVNQGNLPLMANPGQIKGGAGWGGDFQLVRGAVKKREKAEDNLDNPNVTKAGRNKIKESKCPTYAEFVGRCASK